MLTAVILAITAVNIVIEYQFTNTAPRDVYLFTTLFDIAVDGSRSPDRGLVYVVPGEPGEAVIGKYLAAIPQGMRVEAPELPYLEIVRPGHVYTGRAVVPLPLRRYTPYVNPDEPDPGRSGEASRLRLRLGVLDPARFPPSAPVVEPAPPPPPGSFLCDYGFGIAIQRFVETELSLPPHGVPEHFRR